MGTLIQCQSFVSLSVSEMTSLRWEIQIFPLSIASFSSCIFTFSFSQEPLLKRLLFQPDLFGKCLWAFQFIIEFLDDWTLTDFLDLLLI